MNPKLFLLALIGLALFTASGKKQESNSISTTAYDNDSTTIVKDVEIASNYYITFTTAKAVGDEIDLRIYAAEEDRADVWIDLNNNGNKDEGEDVSTFWKGGRTNVKYPIGSQTIVVYGKVEMFCCYKNQVLLLDASNNTALKKLYCDNNQITELNLPNSTALTELMCKNNQLSSLDISNNKALNILCCDNNKFSSLNVTGNPALLILECNDNQLSSLDITNNIALTWLDCCNNQLSSLDVSRNIALNQLYCSGNQLTELDISKNINLTYLSIWDNKISEEAKMQAIVDALPMLEEPSYKSFFVINTDEDSNKITQAQIRQAQEKNWTID